MTDFVLVAGGWHGAWCWERLTPLLEQAGARVHTAGLTGVGELAHLATPEVGLDTHIDDVVRLMEENDLREAVLVGHSYGGMVITGVADRMSGRIAHLVHLDTAVPRDGASMLELVPPLDRILPRWAKREGDGWLVPPPFVMERIPGMHGLFGVTDEADLAWLRPRLTPHPLKSMEQPLRLRSPGSLAAVARTYVHCTEGGPLFRLSRRFKPAFLPPKGPGWRHRRLRTGHDAMITEPRALADILLDTSAD